MHAIDMTSRAFCLALCLFAALPARAEVYFDDGAKINLAAARGAKVSACKTCITPADLVCRPVHTTEMRFQSNYGPAWWMIQWPQTLRLSSHRIGYREPMKSVGYRIKVSLAPLDEAGWAAVKPVFEFRGPLNRQGHDGLCSGWSEGHWPAVDARLVRIEWFGHNGSETGGPGRDHPDLIVGKIQLYGPNRLPITPMISAAQAAWAGGQAALDDARGGNSNFTAAIDDSQSDPKQGFGLLTASYATNPGDADLKKLPARPASIVVTLRHACLVEAVGYSAVAPPRDERPRDVQVFTSPQAIGERWQLQKELHDIAGGAYEEIAFDRPAKAKRVKFVIPRVWNTRADGSRLASGYMAEVYVYGTGLAGNLPFTLDADATVSASIHNARGDLVRTLWQLRAMKAGRYLEEWDGLSDMLAEAPPGPYELRLVSNAGRYENVAAVGNTGSPPTPDGHVPVSIASVAVDRDGAVFSANGWDEAGHDWKKWDRDGRSLMHADFQIRNGDPNGLPYRVAVDDRFLYAAYFSHNGERKAGSQWIQRFDRQTGKSLRFPKGFARNGLIEVYPPPETDRSDWPISGLVVSGDLLLVGDRRANRVLKYDKVSGQAFGEFHVDNPGAMAVDPAGRLWIVRKETEVAVLDVAGGQERARPISGLGKIVGLSFAPRGRLYVADDKARQIAVYQIEELTATLDSSFGRRAQPGDDAPQRFYELIDLAAGPDGSVVTVDRLPVGGSRLARWPARFDPPHPFWTHLGLEFTGNAAYSTEDPDVLVSTYFQRYQLDRQIGGWQFHGNLFRGGNTGDCTWHGAPRWVTLGGQRFFYFANGDGIHAYRLASSGRTTELRFAMAIGGREPAPDGKTERTQGPGQWTWTDARGDGRLDPAEVRWFKRPGQAQLAYFGMNVDVQGNIFYCDHQTRSIWMLPLLRLNAAGDPTYDWSQAREVVPADKSAVKFFPLMAVRTEKGELYAFGRSDLFPPFPGSGPAWMGGWALAKFDSAGRRLWATRLAQHCTGMDYVPGDGGVVLGYFAEAIVYHYNRDGLLVGSARPGKAAGEASGWLDNTASIACNRDPRDGLIDVFAEEDYAHRILWYRLDDAKITVKKVPISLTNTRS
jgi:hypothetical protein